MIRRLNRRERKILIMCLGTVLFYVFASSLAVGLQEEKDSLSKRIKMKQEQRDRGLEAIGQAKDLEEKYDAYFQQFRQTGSKEEIASLILSEIESVAGKLGLHVVHLTPKQVRDNTYDRQFSVNLKINSSLVDVTRFLYILQQKPYLFDVEEVEFEKSARRKKSMMTTRLVLGKMFISETFSDSKAISQAVSSEGLPFDSGSFVVYAQRITERNIFESLREKLKPDGKVLQKALPALHKRVKLIGILLDQDSKAIVEDLKERQTHFLSKGESIGMALLEDIQEDKVIFMYNNQQVEMTP